MDRKSDHFAGQVGAARHVKGPLSFMNPTTRYLGVGGRSGAAAGDGGAKPAQQQEQQQPATAGADKGADADLDATPTESQPPGQKGPDGAYYVWRSRDNRKGRHALIVPKEFRDDDGGHGTKAPPATNSGREVAKGIAKLFIRYPFWDVSYDVAFVFVIGSVIWVINGFFVWLPLQDPSTEFPNESATGGGVTAFIGATVFEFGSILLMLEAVNENRADCFGWALDETVESGLATLRPEHSRCAHSHRNRSTWLRGNHEGVFLEDANGALKDLHGEKAGKVADEDRRGWSWWPSRKELREHYSREIAFWACSAQMFGATVFWIAGITGIPPILNNLSVPATNGIFWLPQVIGGSGFIVSGWLFMIETQKAWYLPAPGLLGWHVGFWNLLGGIGFTMCGGFGFGGSVDRWEYAGALCTFIGSWFFLIGSVLQWYESLDKYPISTESIPER